MFAVSSHPHPHPQPPRPSVNIFCWTKSFKILLWKGPECNSVEVNVKSRLIAHLKPAAVAECWQGRGSGSNTTGRLVSKEHKEGAGGWGSLLPSLLVWLSLLMLNPLISVQCRVTWQPGSGPWVYTWAETAVICVICCNLHTYFHKRCWTSWWAQRYWCSFS